MRTGRKKQAISGISLLEVMLTIAIGAGILIFGGRYFMQAISNQRVTSSLNQIKNVVQAGYKWQNQQTQYDFSGISTQALIDNQLLDPKDAINPWGGSLDTSKDSQYPTHLRITLNSIPSTACRNLVQHLATLVYQGSQSTSQSCGQGGTTQYYGVF